MKRTEALHGPHEGRDGGIVQDTGCVVSMRGIRKEFPGVIALDGVDFDVLPGEAHALVGENGSGKSTLIKILSGVLRADEGEIYVGGERVSIGCPLDAQALGIATIHQEFTLVSGLSVARNVLLAREPRRKGLPVLVDRELLEQQARKVIESIGLDISPRTPVSELGVAERQLIEICKALSTEARVLVMDEPTASLPRKDVQRLFEIVHRLRRQGVSVVYISHRLEEVRAVADRVTVLRDGRRVVCVDAPSVTIDDLVRHVVGRDITEKFPKVTSEPGEELLRVEGLSQGGKLRDVTFNLRAGEILGVAGLVGSGKSELGYTLFGARPYDRGSVAVVGKPVVITSPAAAIRHNIGFVPPDRRTEGLVLLLSVLDNITMAAIERFSRFGFLNRFRRFLTAKSLVSRLAIKTPRLNQRVQLLSGGNQQKVVLAKALTRDSRVVILDEPTRGIDVGSKVELYGLLNGLTGRGAGVIMISSDVPELVGMSDRVLVMSRGRIVAEYGRGRTTEEEVVKAALADTVGDLPGVGGAVRSWSERVGEKAPDIPAATRERRLGGRVSGAIRALGAWSLPLLVLLMLLFFGTSQPYFFTPVNIYNLVRQASLLAIVTSAQVYPLLSGGVDTSIGSVIGLVSVVSALLAIRVGTPLAFLVSLLLGAAIGVANGTVIATFPVSPFMITLGTMSVARGLAFLITSGQPVFGMPPGFNFLGAGELGGIPLPTVIALTVLGGSFLLLSSTRFGYHIYAVGGAEEAARVSGVNVFRCKVAAYAAAGFLAALGGIVLSSRVNSGQPVLGTGAELEALAAAVIGGVALGGGRGTILGAAVGVLVISVLANGLNLMNVSPYIQTLVVGATLIAALVVDRIRVRSSAQGLLVRV